MSKELQNKDEELIPDLKANDDGSYDEVYRSKAGNIVTAPKNRSKGPFKDSRQDICWDYYIKSYNEGRPSAQEAARKAGYAPNTVLNITNLSWFKEKKKKLRRSKMMSKAERNLNKVLDMEYSKMKILDDGSEEEQIDKDLLKIVTGVSTTVVTTLGKDEGYSTKTEIKGDMSGEIKINSVSFADAEVVKDKVIENTQNLIEAEVKEIVENNDK